MSIRISCVVLLITAFLAGTVRSDAAQTASPPVYNPANGHWYQAVQVPGNSIDWPTARAEADSRSYAGFRGHLLTIASEDEQRFVSRHLPVQQQLYWWIGAYQDKSAPDYREPGGGWRWVTGEPWGNYTHWYPGQPDNDGNVHDPDGENALEFDAKLGNLWNDFPVHLRIGGYLVEYEAYPLVGDNKVTQFLLYPSSVAGGQSATGQVMLSQLAGPGGVVVPLASGNPAVAVVPATVTVPTGTNGTTFPITTFPVSEVTSVTLGAGGQGSTVTAALQVLPAETISRNLLVNGSFEEPATDSDRGGVTGDGLPGWRITRGSIDVLISAFWQTAPGSGRQCIDLVGSSPGSIEQSFPTDVDREYIFSGWMAHNPDNRAMIEGRANVFLNGQFFIQLFHRDPQATRADTRWVRFSYRFRAATPSTTMAIEDVTNIWRIGGLFLDGLAVVPADAPVTPTPPPVTPAAPSHLSAAKIAPTRIDLTWKDNSSNEQEFIIWRRSGGGDYVRIGEVGANITTFSDGGLQPKTTYSYLVRAWNPAGASQRSNELTVQTLALEPPPPTDMPPNAPSHLIATAVSPTEISLTWQDNSSDEAAFVIYRKGPMSDFYEIVTVPANSKSYVDRGLQPGTAYRYLVRAWNPKGGASSRSNEAGATTPFAQ